MDSHGPLTTTTRSLALHDNRRIVLTNAKIRSNEPVVTCECIYPRIVRHRRAHEKWQNYQNSNGSGKIRNKVARIDGVQAPFNDEILPRGSLMSITLATSRYNEAWWTFPLWLSVFPIDEHAAKLRPRENNRWQEGGIGFLRARSLPALFIALIHLAWLFFFLCIKRMERGWKCDGLDPSYSELGYSSIFRSFCLFDGSRATLLGRLSVPSCISSFQENNRGFFSFVFYLGELDNGLKREGMKTRQYLEKCNGELEWRRVRLNYGAKAFAFEKNI